MSPWQSLPTRNQSAPPLAWRFIYTPRSYEIYLTDLTYIWFETLEVKSILEKAEHWETSIDPSEDANQYGVFMQKIQNALQGVKQSSVNVTPGPTPNSLVMTTSTSLPGGLKSLEWSFSLLREPPSAVTQHLLLPMLKSECEHDRRERSLLDHLREKDNVLSKIIDKIDSSQLITMFPGTAGIRHTKLRTSDLIKHIRGATNFDEEEWRGSMADEHTVASEARSLAEIANNFTGSSILDSARMNSHTAWWEHLEKDEDSDDDDHRSGPKEKPQLGTRNTHKIDAANNEERKDDDELSTEDEDEFQRQETPPHLKHKKAEASKKSLLRKESEIGADTGSDQAANSSNEGNRRQVHTPKRNTATGFIGGRKSLAHGQPRRDLVSSPTALDTQAERKKSRGWPAASEQASDLDSEHSSDIEAGQVRTKIGRPAKVTAKQGGVLGRIGGKKPQIKRSVSTETPDNDDVTDDGEPHQQHTRTRPLPTSKRVKKLGIIGGGRAKKKSAATHTSEHESDDDLDAETHIGSQKKSSSSSSSSSSPSASVRSPSPVQQRASEPEPESELSAEQKANRRREELKRQLDIKGKAPAKKKRRF